MRLFRSRLTTAVAAVLGLAATTASAAQSQTLMGAGPATTATTTTAANGDTGLTDGGGSTGPASTAVTFASGDFYDHDPSSDTSSVFIADGVTSKAFGFTVAKSYTVSKVELRDSTGGTIATASATTSDGTGISSVDITLSLSTLPTGGQAGIITISNTSQLLAAGYEGTAMYFQVSWTQDGGGDGASFSRTLTFVSSSAVLATFLPQFTNTNPVSAETHMTKTTEATLVATSATSNPTATNADGSISGSNGHSSTKSGSSGISKGAIAGIVVGAVAVIAIVGALAFFCLRRRRNNAANQAYNSALLSGSAEPYRGAGPVSDLGGPHGNLHGNLHDGMGSGTAVNLMEKDAVVGGAAGRFAAGAPDTPNSPHSPYTDEDATAPQTIPSRAVGTSSAGASATASPIVRTAQNVSPAVSPVAVPAQPVSPVAAAPQPVIRNEVAALIEDHMTPEEIARLEAEERELDADIENAIRNRAAASSRQGN